MQRFNASAHARSSLPPNGPLHCSSEFQRAQKPSPDSLSLNGIGVDEDEGYPAGPVRAVAPGMVGAALNEAIPRPHEDLALVHEGPDLAVQDERVVHRA